MDAPLNSEAVKNPMSTRRSKRKVDDLDKPSHGSSKKRQVSKRSNGSVQPSPLSASKQPKPTASKGTRKVNKNIKKDQGGSKMGGISNKALTKKQQEQLFQLLGKANVDSAVLSTVQTKVTNDDENGSPCEDDESDNDNYSPQMRSTTSPGSSLLPSTKQKRISTRRSSREIDIDDDEDHKEDQDAGEFQREQLEDAEERDNLDDELEDDDVDRDTDHPAPALANSDEEQEVSFNINSHGQDTPQEVRTTGQNPSPTPSKNSSPPRLEHANDGATMADQVRECQIGIPTLSNRIDDSVLMNMITLMQWSITSSVEASNANLLAEIRANREETKRLREHVTELTTVISNLAVAVFNKHPSSNPRVKEIHRKLCLLPALFNDSFLLKILPRVVIGFIVNVI